MKRMIAVLAMLVLAGCSTYSDMQQKPPAYAADSSKAPQTYADCALPKLVNIEADVHAIPSSGGIDIVVPVGNPGADLSAMVSVRPAGGGSHVAVRGNVARNARRTWEIASTCL